MNRRTQEVYELLKENDEFMKLSREAKFETVLKFIEIEQSALIGERLTELRNEIKYIGKGYL